MHIQDFHIYPGYFDKDSQIALTAELRKIAKKAAFFRPEMPRTGKVFSVEMTSAGPLGWLGD